MKKRFVKRSFAAIALLAMAAPAFCNVFGPDDRQPVTTLGYPWRAVGWVSSGGTGTLVGPNLVLTAAHVVFDDNGNWLPSAQYFYPDMIGNNAFTRSWIKRAWYGTRFPSQDRENDWAILELSDNLGYVSGWMSCNDNLPEQATLVGYSGDMYSGRTATTVLANFRGREGDFLLHDGDDTRGSSGGPMFVMYDETPAIVALNVAERRHGSETSLWVAWYAPEYANVAIPASRFLPILNRVLAGQNY